MWFAGSLLRFEFLGDVLYLRKLFHERIIIETSRIDPEEVLNPCFCLTDPVILCA